MSLLFFLLFIGALLVVMKLVAWWLRGRPTPAPLRFWLSPLPAPNSLTRTAPRRELNRRLVRAAFSAGALALGYSIFWSQSDQVTVAVGFNPRNPHPP
jgi:hypothetical protein